VDVRIHGDGEPVAVEIIDTGPGHSAGVVAASVRLLFSHESTAAEGSGLGSAIAKHAADKSYRLAVE
jgi:hypothetical protein